MKQFSLFSLLLSFIIIIAAASYYPKFNKTGTEATISYDVAGYYLYLPAIFIYHDVQHLAFVEQMNDKYQFTPDVYQAVPLGNDNYTMKYPIGAAVMYAPFFFIAHFWANLGGINADGFSPPYQRMLSLGCLLYAFLGLAIMRKILLRYFSEFASGLTILFLVLATNYLNYSAIDNSMTHNLLFTLFTSIIWFTIKFYEKPNIISALALGLFCGLVTIIRPTDIIICIIPFLWGIHNWQGLLARINMLLAHWKKILAFILIAFIVVSLQLAYWKMTTGHWIFYSYSEQGFDWFNPHITNGLISYKKGWWLYTPFMLIIIPGFILLYKQKINLFFPVLLFTIINLYIVFSWSIWWYGGSLGQRSLIESYALLSFPIAASFQFLMRSKKWVMIPFGIFLILTSWHNIVLTIQAHHKQGILDAENTNKTYFWQTVGKLSIDNDVKRFLDTDERYRGTRVHTQQLYFNDIEYDLVNIDSSGILYGKKCLFVDEFHQSTQPYRIPNPPPGSSWISVSADFYTTGKVWDVWKMPQFIVQFKNQDQLVKTQFIRVHRLIEQGQKRNLFFDIQIPEAHFTTIDFFLWNAGSKTDTYMDNIKVDLLK